MKKYLILFGWLVLTALNWAALHDIIKGEPDTRLEWTFFLASAALVTLALIKTRHPRT